MRDLRKEGKVGNDKMMEEVHFGVVWLVNCGETLSYYWKMSVSIENEGKGPQWDKLESSIPNKG